MNLFSSASYLLTLLESDFAAEVCFDYIADAKSGLLKIDRYLGFVQGLCAAGAISYQDWCDISLAVTSGEDNK